MKKLTICLRSATYCRSVSMSSKTTSYHMSGIAPLVRVPDTASRSPISDHIPASTRSAQNPSHEAALETLPPQLIRRLRQSRWRSGPSSAADTRLVHARGRYAHRFQRHSGCSLVRPLPRRGAEVAPGQREREKTESAGPCGSKRRHTSDLAASCMRETGLDIHDTITARVLPSS